jgi:hypothetical protein
MKNAKYVEASENLVKAIDIAIDVLKVAPPKDFREQDKQQFISVYSGWKEELINPQLQYANMASLKYSIDEVFTYFQEDSGQTVETFWQKIKEADLPYKRENKMAKILKRKRIKDDIEYNFVIDVLTPYHQEGLITEEELVLLNQWIGDFENKTKN